MADKKKNTLKGKKGKKETKEIKEAVKSESVAEIKEKSDHKNDWIFILIPLIIILLLIGGIFAIRYIYKPKPNVQSVEFNGFVFVNQSGVWTTQMQMQDHLYDLMFKYNPYDVKDIEITYMPNNFSKLTALHDKMYIVFDPEDENLGYIALAATDISRALTRVYGITPIAACTKNLTTACANVPIQTCNTTGRPVIYLDNDPTQKIIYTGNCLIIQGEKDDLLKAVQRVLFEWYKIIYSTK